MFHQARLKLTAWYLLIITIISLSFSLLIYQLINTEITRFADSQRNRFERRLEIDNKFSPPIIIVDQDLINESRRRLLLNLIFINSSIIIISGTFSYFLAGKTLSPIKKMLEDQQRFTSDASHELRTPLTALKSLFEVSLRDKKLTLSEAKKVISQGIDQTDKLKNLSDSLLELSSLETKKIQTSFEPVSLKTISSAAISQLSQKINIKKIKVINQTKSINIFGDKSKLIELLVIFIDNAVKYSPKSATIRLSSESDESNVVVKIIDNGIGISQEDIPRIFDRFYQADNARTKSKNNGYGIGLSIAQKIVQAHNGRIDVISKVNQGTTFIVNLPKAK